jgi:hypothetical protein
MFKQYLSIQFYLISVQKALDGIRAGIFSEDPNLQLRATRNALEMLENANPPLTDAFIEARIISRLVSFMEKPELHNNVIFILAQITSKTATDHQIQVVVDAGAVPHLIRLLGSDDSQLRLRSFPVLIAIAGKTPEFRDFVVECGIIEPLLRLARSEVIVENSLMVCLTVGRLVTKGSSPPIDLIKKLFPILLKFLQHANAKIVSYACLGIAETVLKSDAIKLAVLIKDFGIVPQLVRLLGHEDVDIISDSLCALTIISSGTSNHSKVVLEAGALPVIAVLLKNTTLKIVKVAVLFLSYVLAGKANQIQKVIDAQILQPLIEVLSTGDLESRKAAVRAVRNLSMRGTRKQIITLNQRGVLKPLCDLLTSNDVQLVNLILEGIENILVAVKRHGKAKIVAGSIDDCLSVGNLLIHENKDVKKKALKIIKTYFH